MEENSANIGRWLKLYRAEGVGPVSFFKLLKYFGDIDGIFGASVAGLSKVSGIGTRTAEKIARTRDKFDSDRELELAEKLGVWVINYEDQRYPSLLRKIYDPPPVLYVKGSLSIDDNLALAIVGSRRASLYGKEQAEKFAHLLSSAGFTICSGMARGIDTAAHGGALAAGNRTIAVQGCGLANIFPPENKNLFERITENGACLSELPLEYEPLAENFPPRNRIVAGLSLATIVIEATLRSGALISARMAMENGRDVMAVPGKVDSPLSKGAHQLIKNGAALIENVEDVMAGLGYIGEQIGDYVREKAGRQEDLIEMSQQSSPKLKLSGDEEVIYNVLAKEPSHIEDFSGDTGLGIGAVNAGLISLRLKGLIRQLPGNMFARR